MKKFNFLSKAALLVAPFAVVATLGAANANAAENTAATNTAATNTAAVDSARTNAVSADDSASTTAHVNYKPAEVKYDGTKLMTIVNGDNASIIVKKAANNIAYYANQSKDALLANNAKLANEEAKDLATFNAYLPYADSSNKALVSDVNANDAKVTEAVKDVVYSVPADKNHNPKKVTATDIKKDIQAVRNILDGKPGVENTFDAFTKAMTKLTSDQKAYNARKNGEFSVSAQKEAINNELVKLEEAANKKAAKPAKKHARKHARRLFRIRVKAHKIYAYKTANFRHHAGRKAEKRGKKLNVYGIIKKGHKTFYRVFGHRVITSNKHFVTKIR